MPKPQETAPHTPQKISENFSIAQPVLNPINFY